MRETRFRYRLDEIVIERGSEESAVATRILRAIAVDVPVRRVENAREGSSVVTDTVDPFGAGKRTLVLTRRRSPFLMACPAGSAKFACCGYLVLTIASNCPMDCSYCFLQEYLADNPAFQIFTNYTDAYDELDRLVQSAPGRHFRVGTGELADSLAFDSITGISRDLIEFFAKRANLTLEFKTKTAEIENLLGVDPRGRVLVSWTLSPEAVFGSSETRTAPPKARIAAARAVLDAGYRVAFHFDPLIAYPDAERDYALLIDELLETIPAKLISFVSIGGLRMTPTLRAVARRRFPDDPMLCTEDVLSADGRYRTFAPLRLKLYRVLADCFRKQGAEVPAYLCMEPASVHERVFGDTPGGPAVIRERLATR
jgi:spore photoproduct lyase